MPHALVTIKYIYSGKFDMTSAAFVVLCRKKGDSLLLLLVQVLTSIGTCWLESHPVTRVLVGQVGRVCSTCEIRMRYDCCFPSLLCRRWCSPTACKKNWWEPPPQSIDNVSLHHIAQAKCATECKRSEGECKLHNNDGMTSSGNCVELSGAKLGRQ